MFCPNGKISKNKYWELQISCFKCFRLDKIFNFQCQWTLKGDHCGFSLIIGILTVYFHFLIYDDRHWNCKEDKFQN